MAPRTLLYIEDDQENFDLVCRLLAKSKDIKIIGAESGKTGLNMILASPPDLVLVDLEVPEINGFEVARQISRSERTEIANIPICAVSAHVLQDERKRALESGCREFFEKPFDIKLFRQRIHELLGLEVP